MKFQIPNSNFQIRTRGFTIVETLVAITVLMIAIAGPLVVASKGLFGALASKDQMVAAYLAQESMETIKNIRDNNIFKLGIGTNNYLINPSDQSNNLATCTLTGNPCDASAADALAGGSEIIHCSGACQVYLEYLSGSASFYGHGGNELSDITLTPFARYFYLSDVSPVPNPDEKIVTVVVDWKEGTTPYSVSLSSELTDSIR